MRALILTALAVLLLVSGCGGSNETTPGHMNQGQMQRRMEGHHAAMRARHQAMMRRARMQARHRAMMVRRRHRQTMRRQRAAMRRLHAEEAAQRAAAAKKTASESSECDPNYTGACLDPYASDYDCEGGSGNGPKYTGEVTVVGVDHYGLDADGDGIGCESE